MSSPAQRRANRHNAKRSTGPKTPEGKLASSRNNLRHGLAGRLILANLSPEDAADFNELASSLHAEHAPATSTELLLVDRMTESFYMSSRAIALQSAALLSGDDTRFSLLLRYQTTHERCFYKSLSELTKLRKERRRDQIGFESQNAKFKAHDAPTPSLVPGRAQRKPQRADRPAPVVRNPEEQEVAKPSHAPLPVSLLRPLSPEIAAINRRLERIRADLKSKTASPPGHNQTRSTMPEHPPSGASAFPSPTQRQRAKTPVDAGDQ